MAKVIRLFSVLLPTLLAAGWCVGGELVPNRMATAKTGEWALYEMPDGYVQKHIVAAREGSGPEAEVTIRIENIYDGQVVETKELQMEAGEPWRESYFAGDDTKKVAVETGRTQVAGKDIATVTVRVTDAEGNESEWVVSPEIPVFGLIRQSGAGAPSYRLKEWGE